MKFLYPYFLFALLTISIPLIIHFFNFKRYKTVYFSQLAFLKLVQKETRKKSQLKHLLILFARILSIIFLVIAFSQPYIPVSEEEKNSPRQIVGVYIDNSFSMRLEGEKGVLLEQARNYALDIAGAYRPGTKFLLLTNDFLPQHRNPLDRSQFITQVSELQTSPTPANFEQMCALAHQQFELAGRKYEKSLFLLSDFQKKGFAVSTLLSDSTAHTFLVPFTPGKVNNLYIDSCWFDIPGRRKGQAEKLFARMINSSAESYQNIPVRLLINDSIKAITTLTIAPGEQQTIELAFTANNSGFQFAEVQLDDYPLVYDNNFYLTWEVKNKVEMLAIMEEKDPSGRYFNALFSNDELISFEQTAIGSLQLSSIKNKHCIALVNLRQISSGLTDELIRFTQQGGTVMIFPSAQAETSSYNQLLAGMNAFTLNPKDTSLIGISSIQYNHPVFRNVFIKPDQEASLPKIRNSYSLNRKNNGVETRLLELRNGQSALSVFPAGKGKLYLFTFPVDADNQAFNDHLLFVPSVYNPALNSLSPQPLSYAIEQQNLLLVNREKITASNQPLILKKRTSNESLLLNGKPIGAHQIQFDLSNFINSAGHYLILDHEKTIDALAYNYKRDESEPYFYTSSELKELIEEYRLSKCSIITETTENARTIIQEMNQGKTLWKYFMALVLLFIGLEMLIIRFWK